MKLLFCLSGVFLWAPGLLAQPKVMDWKPFVPSDKEFSILLPGVPKKKSREIKTRKGIVEVTSLTLVAKGKGGFYFSFSQPRKSSASRSGEDDRLKQAKTKALKTIRGVLKKEQKLELGNFPGVELYISIKQNKHLRLRLFVIEDRLYQLLVVGTPAQVASADTNRYFASFKLTK